jgi:hypothetical protein
MRKLLHFLSILIVLTSNHPARGKPATPACTDSEFHQFDFWVGQWRVTNPQGNEVGTSEVTRVSAGCAVREHWHASSGGDGMSLNYYSREDGQWHQDWVGADGTILHLHGNLTHGAMILSEETRTGKSHTINRITWTPLAGGKVKQQWDISTDNGKTWQTSFVGLYEKQG